MKTFFLFFFFSFFFFCFYYLFCDFVTHFKNIPNKHLRLFTSPLYDPLSFLISPHLFLSSPAPSFPPLVVMEGEYYFFSFFLATTTEKKTVRQKED